MKGVAPTSRLLSFGDLRINEASREVFVDRRSIRLTRKEFDLLRELAHNAGEPLTRVELLRAVWGNAFEGSDQTISVHVRRLRLKIERDPECPELIETVWGVGYRFRG